MKPKTAALALLLTAFAACSFGPPIERRDGNTVWIEGARGDRIAIDVKPLASGRLTSSFGERRGGFWGFGTRLHKGIDYGAATGTPIYAAGNGCIALMRSGRGYGQYIVIKHDHDVETLYAHLSQFAPGLRRGDCLSRGQLIGYVGTTGNATGPHLHFELRYDGEQIDPLDS